MLSHSATPVQAPPEVGVLPAEVVVVVGSPPFEPEPEQALTRSNRCIVQIGQIEVEETH